MAFPGGIELDTRLETVCKTLYLLFNEGYYSLSHDSTIRQELCFEAMRLTHLLIDNEKTNQPAVYALLALMSFQSSRLKARMDDEGEIILYDDQDSSLWDKALIDQGEYLLNMSSQGEKLSRYHLEAGIAYWHTHQSDTTEKWEHILQLYNHLLQLEYSPIAALNRTYALSKANGKAEALSEAQKLNLDRYHLYHVLLGELYMDVDNPKALSCLGKALQLATSATDKKIIEKKISRIKKEQ